MEVHIESILSRFREHELRELREECARLRKERNEIKKALQLNKLPYEPDLGISVTAHLEMAMKDAERLNWLERRSNEEICELRWLNNIRTDIDAAMQPSAQSK